MTRRARVETVRVWREPLPRGVRYSGIVVMGGPMGANDGATLSWINDEISFLRRALRHDVPIWGVCLGAQLLAAALDAKVTTGERPEVGILPVQLKPAATSDPVWSGLTSPFHALQWHGDTFELPSAATLLGSSHAYPNQLFRHGRSYGVQFHIEATAELAEQWLALDVYAASAEASLGPDASRQLLHGVRSAEEQSTYIADVVMSRWLAGLKVGASEDAPTSVDPTGR